ncbi:MULTISPECIES: hypothetical protein [Streptomyces]|uniref:Glyoxalase/fosfomycin resistance/dioxygenase domain-containing protein n=1 Tax=Streptomyces luteosporeus TaxID=173856 RepID=A0ABP6G5K1_9ACTN
MATKETFQRFVPLLYVHDSLEAIAFYTDIFGVEELTERTMLLSQVPGMDKIPGAGRANGPSGARPSRQLLPASYYDLSDSPSPSNRLHARSLDRHGSI